MTYQKLILAIHNNAVGDIRQCLEREEVQKELATKDNMLQALRLAAKKGHVAAFQEMMNNELARNVFIREGLEILKQAVAYNQVDMLIYLLKFESMQNVLANEENVLLIRAASSGHIKIVDILLKYKAVCDAITARDHAALNEAVLKGRRAVIYRLALTYQRLGLELPPLNVNVSNDVEMNLQQYVAQYKSQLEMLYAREVEFFKTVFMPMVAPLPLRELTASFHEPPEYLPTEHPVKMKV
jgi:hypothetical protein